MSYQYCETDPFKRPTQLLEANPRGTVPAIREGDWACGESAIILEYVRGRSERREKKKTDVVPKRTPPADFFFAVYSSKTTT